MIIAGRECKKKRVKKSRLDGKKNYEELKYMTDRKRRNREHKGDENTKIKGKRKKCDTGKSGGKVSLFFSTNQQRRLTTGLPVGRDC